MIEFKREDTPIIKNQSDSRRKGICFLLSFLIHAVLFCLIISNIIPVKIYTIKGEIFKVHITSSEKIFFPEILDLPAAPENIIERAPEKGPAKSIQLYEAEQEFKNALETETDISPGEKVYTNQNFYLINSKEIKNKADNLIPDTDFSSGFELAFPWDSTLNLPSNSDIKENKFTEIDKDKKIRGLNLPQYFYPEFSNALPTKNKASSDSYSSRRTPKRGNVSFHTKDYDITPWAQKVVKKIQNNWIISSPEKTATKGRVGISVIIKKNGELSSIEVVNSSDTQLLDQAALKALKLSSPLPELPDDFPNKSLEAYFLFHYDE